MASARVDIDGNAIIQTLNTPGGGVFRWRDEIGREIKAVAQGNSPINDAMNCVHRGGVRGTYKRGWDWNRIGSNGNTVRANVFNTAPHAVYVEYGRSMSRKLQIFSWTAWGGQIKRVGGPPPPHIDEFSSKRKRALAERVASMPEYAGSKTAARPGKYILTRAVAAVMGSSGIGV